MGRYLSSNSFFFICCSASLFFILLYNVCLYDVNFNCLWFLCVEGKPLRIADKKKLLCAKRLQKNSSVIVIGGTERELQWWKYFNTYFTFIVFIYQFLVSLFSRAPILITLYSIDTSLTLSHQALICVSHYVIIALQLKLPRFLQSWTSL